MVFTAAASSIAPPDAADNDDDDDVMVVVVDGTRNAFTEQLEKVLVKRTMTTNEERIEVYRSLVVMVALLLWMPLNTVLTLYFNEMYEKTL
mmetsp:Transcript_9678/g.14249  ORF Transcript_9678/g.14249 Transcript_9678/m.14249 type:complete len:91 (+) Transcript_9678:992-1264(+)